jgi:hypothetical protein
MSESCPANQPPPSRRPAWTPTLGDPAAGCATVGRAGPWGPPRGEAMRLRGSGRDGRRRLWEGWWRGPSWKHLTQARLGSPSSRSNMDLRCFYWCCVYGFLICDTSPLPFLSALCIFFLLYSVALWGWMLFLSDGLADLLWTIL